jgi:hypothetical protein
MLIEMENMQHNQEEKESRLMLDVEKQTHDMEMSEAELDLEATQKRNVSIG